MEIDKKLLVDSDGKPLTQSLFLEIAYSEKAVYSLKEIDWEYKGKVYPSLKRLYLEKEDVTEYEFANTYLLSWNHWRRMNENKQLSKYFQEWREELELKMRCKGIKRIIEDGSFNSAKWLAEKGWDKKEAGRPTKLQVEQEKKFQAHIASEYSADIHRLYATKE